MLSDVGGKDRELLVWMHYNFNAFVPAHNGWVSISKVELHKSQNVCVPMTTAILERQGGNGKRG